MRSKWIHNLSCGRIETTRDRLKYFTNKILLFFCLCHHRKFLMLDQEGKKCFGDYGACVCVRELLCVCVRELLNLQYPYLRGCNENPILISANPFPVNIIIPCMGISFLTVLTFYLPSDSGEKVSIMSRELFFSSDAWPMICVLLLAAACIDMQHERIQHNLPDVIVYHLSFSTIGYIINIDPN